MLFAHNSEKVMKYLIVGIFVVVVVCLVWRSKQSIDPVEQACAREIGDLLKSDLDTRPDAIADIFVKHGIVRSRCQNVSRMVMPQLRKHGLKPEDAKIAMISVTAACPLVPQEKPGAD